MTETRIQRYLAPRSLPALSALAAVLLTDAAILMGIGLNRVNEPGFQATLRFTQTAIFLAAAVLGCLSLLASFRLRRASQPQSIPDGSRPQLLTAFRWSLYLTVILLAASWTLWNYRIDGVMTWPDTEDYAMVASQTWYTPAFWTGGNPPGLPLLFKVFGLNWDTFNSPQYDDIARQITYFQTALSFLAIGCIAFSLAYVIRQKWLRPVAVLVVFGLGMSADVAQWNKMLLSESLSTSLFFGLVAGVILLARWSDESESAQGLMVAALTTVIVMGIALYAFTRDVNSYFLLALDVLTLPVVVIAAVRRKRWWWAYAVIVGIMLLAAVGSAVSRRSRWSYPFINLIYDRVLPDKAAIDFFVRYDFPIEVIESIQPKSRNDLQVAYKGDQGELLRVWFEQSARQVHIKFLLSQPLETLSTPLADLPTLLSPDVSWYRVRLHPEPPWLPLASAVFYPKSSFILGLWFIAVMGATAALTHKGRGRAVWAVPLLVLTTLYPLFLVIWHGDSAALERHSFPVGLGLRLSLWLLTFFILDTTLARYTTHSIQAVASAKPDPHRMFNDN
jgi:hypothetical protein